MKRAFCCVLVLGLAGCDDQRRATLGPDPGIELPEHAEPLDPVAADLRPTGRDLDLAVSGEGWLVLSDGSGPSHFARSVSLRDDGLGRLVTDGGLRLHPPMKLPANVLSIHVDAGGTVRVWTVGRPSEPVPVGRVLIARFAHEDGLEPLGGGIYRVGAGSGPPLLDAPGAAGRGRVHQGYLAGPDPDAQTGDDGLLDGLGRTGPPPGGLYANILTE